MKKVALLSLFFLIVLGISFAQTSNVTVAEIKTSAVCESCKERIEKNLKKVEGIISADLNVDTKILKVEFDSSKISLDEIKQRVSKIGYDADEVKRDPKAYKKLPKCCRIDG
jgi:copper chaperone CopZ